MTIIIGRGNKREVISLPCGALLAQAAKEDPEQYNAGFLVVLHLLRMHPNTD